MTLLDTSELQDLLIIQKKNPIYSYLISFNLSNRFVNFNSVPRFCSLHIINMSLRRYSIHAYVCQNVHNFKHIQLHDTILKE
jgi:hypothetical protein